jgi:hypothetical protein
MTEYQMTMTDEFANTLASSLTLDTPVDATVIPYEPTREELSIQINILQREVERLTTLSNNYRNYHQSLETKINNVKGYIDDIISTEGEVSDEVKEISSYLGIALTKTYDVTITVTYGGSIEIPMDADINDFDEHVDFEFSAPFSDEWEFDICQEDADIQYEEA